MEPVDSQLGRTATLPAISRAVFFLPGARHGARPAAVYPARLFLADKTCKNIKKFVEQGTSRAMLPQNHLFISTLTIAPVATVYAGKAEDVLLWVLVGGLVSIAMDLDVIILVFLRARVEKRLQPYRNPVLIFREFDRFMTVLKETGVRDTVLKTHFMTSAVVPPIFYLFWPAVVIPAALGVISHLLSDLADINRSSED